MADLLILAEAANDAAAHVEPTALGFTPGGWVALSMIALIGLMIYLGVPGMVAGALDRKIANIRAMLDEAEQLRKEAEALKAEYQEKLSGAAKHADELRAGAEAEAAQIVARAKDDAAALIARRKRMAEEKIAAAERAAIEDLRAKTATAAAAAARELIAEKHDEQADRKLADDVIASI